MGSDGAGLGLGLGLGLVTVCALTGAERSVRFCRFCFVVLEEGFSAFQNLYGLGSKPGLSINPRIPQSSSCPFILPLNPVKPDRISRAAAKIGGRDRRRRENMMSKFDLISFYKLPIDERRKKKRVWLATCWCFAARTCALQSSGKKNRKTRHTEANDTKNRRAVFVSSFVQNVCSLHTFVLTVQSDFRICSKSLYTFLLFSSIPRSAQPWRGTSPTLRSFARSPRCFS
jgi:hypothetical protein